MSLSRAALISKYEVDRDAVEDTIHTACVAYFRERFPTANTLRHDGGDPCGPRVWNARHQKGSQAGAAA